MASTPIKFVDDSRIRQLWNKVKQTISKNSIPVGTILIWSGSESSIPEGYAICNGQNGTIDLRGKIVIGDGLTTLMSGYPVFESSGASPYVQLYYIQKIS